MKKLIVAFGILIFIISCKDVSTEPLGNRYHFNEPQPANDSELADIPTKFQGIFMNSDSTYLNIKKI